MTPNEIARAALNTALRDPRVGFAIKASMMGGAYEVFLEKIADAIRDAQVLRDSEFYKSHPGHLATYDPDANVTMPAEPTREEIEACSEGGLHEWAGWREFDDGRGGEQFCQKCKLGAMGHTLTWSP